MALGRLWNSAWGRRCSPFVPHHRQGLSSSSPHDVVAFELSHFSFARFFSLIVSGEDVPQGKPAPDIFLRVAEKLVVEPGDCLVIEDSASGILAAKAAGDGHGFVGLSGAPTDRGGTNTGSAFHGARESQNRMTEEICVILGYPGNPRDFFRSPFTLRFSQGYRFCSLYPEFLS